MKVNKFLIATFLAMCIVGFSMSYVSANTHQTKEFNFKANVGDIVNIYKNDGDISVGGTSQGHVFDYDGSWSPLYAITYHALGNAKISASEYLFENMNWHTGKYGSFYQLKIIRKGTGTGKISTSFHDYTAKVTIK